LGARPKKYVQFDHEEKLKRNFEIASILSTKKAAGENNVVIKLNINCADR
jgi:hypothetical protein